MPADCVFSDDVLANLDAEAAIGQWSRGFMRGRQWLEELWESCVPNELDEEFAAMLLTLSFFASADIENKRHPPESVGALLARCLTKGRVAEACIVAESGMSNTHLLRSVSPSVVPPIVETR